MKIRKIKYSDCKELYEWRNDPVTKSMSKESDNINYETHNDWFKASISDPNKIFFIGECNEGNIGVCRFDFDFFQMTQKYQSILIQFSVEEDLVKNFYQNLLKFIKRIMIVI